MPRRKYGHLVMKFGGTASKPRQDCPRCQAGACVRHGVRLGHAS